MSGAFGDVAASHELSQRVAKSEPGYGTDSCVIKRFDGLFGETELLSALCGMKKSFVSFGVMTRAIHGVDNSVVFLLQGFKGFRVLKTGRR